MEALLQPLVFRDGRCLPCRLIPGPMDGVTEGSFVSVLSRRGYVWSWHTPFVRVSTGVAGRGRLRAFLAPYLSTGLPVTAQIMGTSVERLAATAARLQDEGAVSVDLNCACPSPTVLGSGSGGARLRDPGWLREAVTAMREACGLRGVSVKVRMGVESAAEFPGIAAALREASPDLVIVHFRTVREQYRPIEGGLERLRQAVECLEGIPVFGSGDLLTVDDCLRMAEETGVAGLAPARGLLRHPSLLTEVRARLLGEPLPAPPDAAAYLLELVEEAGRRGSADNGFVLRVAGLLAGRDSELFRQLAAWHTVERTREGLRAWCAAKKNE